MFGLAPSFLTEIPAISLQAKRFKKAQCPIVERLTNSMMMFGRNNGKKVETLHCRLKLT
jgi:ribosomal protein S7